MKKIDVVLNPMENAIVFLDMGITSISIINKIKEKFPNETICYMNDLEYGEYEGHEPMDIKSRIKKIVEIISNNKPKLLYVLNSVFVEYGEGVFDNLEFPVINIVKTIVDYVNNKYEYRALAFLANDGIIENNMYQKGFHYSHLYNVKVNNVIECVNNKLIKTKESFNVIRDCAIQLSKRDIEIIVTPEINLLLLYTEFGEYFKDADLIRTDEAIVEVIEAEVSKNPNSEQVKQKNRIDLYIYSNDSDKYRERDAFRKLLDSSINYQFVDYQIKK